MEEREKRDFYNANRKPTGETYYKGDPLPRDKYIFVVIVFIQNSEGKFLIQKRSVRKNGKFATTGGHPKSGEDSIQGILTETKEEMGLDLKKEDLQLYYSGISDEEMAIWDDYYIKMDIPDINKLELQESEVESVHWFTADEIHESMKNGTFFDNQYAEFKILEDWLKDKDKKL